MDLGEAFIRFSQIRLALRVPTYSVQCDLSNVRESSSDPGFLGVIPQSSGSSGSLYRVPRLCFALLCLALVCLCPASLRFAVLCCALPC